MNKLLFRKERETEICKFEFYAFSKIRIFHGKWIQKSKYLRYFFWMSLIKSKLVRTLGFKLLFRTTETG